MTSCEPIAPCQPVAESQGYYRGPCRSLLPVRDQSQGADFAMVSSSCANVCPASFLLHGVWLAPCGAHSAGMSVDRRHSQLASGSRVVAAGCKEPPQSPHEELANEELEWSPNRSLIGECVESHTPCQLRCVGVIDGGVVLWNLFGSCLTPSCGGTSSRARV